MWDRIESLIELAVGPVRRLATDVRNALAALYSTVTAVMTGIGGKWTRLSNVASYVRDRLRRYASEVYTTLRWLALVQVPRVAAQWADRLQRWALTTMGMVERRLSSLVDGLARWARGAIGAIVSTLDGLSRWVQREVGQVRTWLSWFTATVLPRLTNPGMMADWLAGAMFTAFVRIVESHAEAFAEWVARNAVRVALRQLPRIERFIVRMF